MSKLSLAQKLTSNWPDSWGYMIEGTPALPHNQFVGGIGKHYRKRVICLCHSPLLSGRDDLTEKQHLIIPYLTL